MSVFKAYDIRGIYNKNGFDKTLVYKVGRYLPFVLNAKKILIGRDIRLSSDEMFEALTNGIVDSGADVYNLGLATTPYVYYATAVGNFDASIQITASHNSKEYNGMKISREQARPVGYESGISEIEKLINENTELKESSVKGKIFDYSKNDEYIEFQSSFANTWDLNIACDNSNGMANLFIKDIFSKNIASNKKVVYINDTLDGTFPAHEPNPLEEKNCEQLKELVKNSCSDIGVIFDGDADRVIFVDDKARFVPPDMMTAIIAKHYLEKENNVNILMDIRSSKSVYEFIEKNGGIPHIWKVGHVYSKAKLPEINALCGGELAGHYYFKEFFNCDSAILACMLCLNAIDKLKKRGVKFSDFLDSISLYSNSGELNFRIENKVAAMDKVREIFTTGENIPTKIYDFDGYRIEFEDYWFNIRMSNTEPYLRLVVEAKNEELLKEKVDTISGIINAFS